MDLHIIDNIAWHTLAGPHAAYACGSAEARRYLPGYSPILGFADAERPDFAALRPWCESGEQLYCAGWSGAAPAGWQILAEATMHKMVLDAPAPAVDPDFEVTRLTSAHATQILELLAITLPGPFGARTLELGNYFGCFDGSRLVAVAGERMLAGGFRELCTVCTHPEFQGRGFARRLVAKLIQLQIQRQEHPFLHVMADNVGARRIYDRMGFRQCQETVARIVVPD